jgi:hypothetical protein
MLTDLEQRVTSQLIAASSNGRLKNNNFYYSLGNETGSILKGEDCCRVGLLLKQPSNTKLQVLNTELGILRTYLVEGYKTRIGN